MGTEIRVNGRDYPVPDVPVVVICLDGCEPAYFSEAIAAGEAPCLERIIRTGTSHPARCVIPSFTNPNNLSIATGRLPDVHGICGNFLYDPVTRQEVMMNDVRFLRAPTIFQAFHDAGMRVAVVTAKDKLRALLGAGLGFSTGRAICFSAEKADRATRESCGIENASAWLGLPVPDVYSAELSGFVLAAGVRLLKEWRPDLLYLTTTDYIQHKHAPGTPVANAFYRMFDGYLGEMDRMGAVVVITADHGMKPKHDAAGAPCIIYLQDILDSWLGEGAARVILPITDPYVVHHGALGAFATAWLPGECDTASLVRRLLALTGIELVLERDEACARFGLPGDRIGDLVLTSGERFVIGTSVHRHDLSALKEPLRSHGGLHEQDIPFVINRGMQLDGVAELRNLDAFFHGTRAAAAAGA